MQGITPADWSYTEYANLPSKIEDSAAGIEQAARQFESLFINMWLKSAREANAVMAEGNFMSSAEMTMQQEMFDAQMAMHLSKEGGIGLAPVIVRQLGGEATKPVEARSEVMFQDLHSMAASKEEMIPSAVHSAGAELQQQGSRAQMFTDAKSFLDAIAPHVRGIAGAAGLPAAAVMAQAALETGWGSAVIQNGEGQSSHNLFGMKGNNWSGPTVDIHSKEHLLGRWLDKLDSFRAYPDWQSSVRDYTDMITQSSRYADAAKTSMDALQYADFLQQQGYATDPSYAQKLKDLVHRISELGF